MARQPSTREIPPPLELACLRALWALGQGNVTQVRDWLAPQRDLAYTTVLTLLERLARRGLATRRKHGRAFLYAAARDRETLRHAALRELLEDYFDGSRASLLDWLEASPAPAPPAPAAEEPAPDPGRLDAALL